MKIQVLNQSKHPLPEDTKEFSAGLDFFLCRRYHQQV